jgi:hypothetical protein
MKIGEYTVRKLDKYNWVIESHRIIEKGKKAGEEKIVTEGYFPKLQLLSLALLEMLVKDSDVEDVENLISAIDYSTSEIIKATEGIK